MKVAIIGGGPAGLYFAILIKKKHPEYQVVLFERNRPNDTFGWGVVFSDKTLSYLRDSDEPSYQKITESFATWDNVDVVHRGVKITIRGNKFSGISRLGMLQILQERCAELGVEMHFQEFVTDFSIFSNFDLVLAADGVNSEVRQKFAVQLEPDVTSRNNRYIWYGTNKLFHGLTLTFHQNDDGIFAAHSYKFNATTSTFIVECDEATWQKAGFATMSEPETRAYLEKVFADDLDGEPLMSNNSKWLNFLLVKNKHWHFDNVVLLGDALHTAHFSIGSGTKLALEDSIALFNAIESSDTVKAALQEFERVRRPIIDEYQQAAFSSLVWFENLKDVIDLEPMPFAYSLMSRSNRIDHENLRKRDPKFMADYEAYVREHGAEMNA
ncbi:MAG: FAD-dependent monooxygenase [Candidatus Kapaibacterium sp.]|jgi:anthraniloyl-CoA monooxygenase